MKEVTSVDLIRKMSQLLSTMKKFQVLVQRFSWLRRAVEKVTDNSSTVISQDFAESSETHSVKKSFVAAHFPEIKERAERMVERFK